MLEEGLRTRYYGSHEGGAKAAITNKALYGDRYYEIIGRRGGLISRGGGFAANPELARIAGAKGGRKSRGGGRRTQIKLEQEELF